MDEWLKATAEFVLTHRSTEILAKLTQLIKSRLNLKSVYVLTISDDGRFFECVKNNQKLTWGVSDFNNPFSHVARSSASMTLANNEILYWLSDKDFSALMQPINELDLVSIIPLETDHVPLQAMLVLQGKDELAIQISKDKSFQLFISICASHLNLLNDVEIRKQNSHRLIESLAEVEEGNKKNHIADELARILIGDSSEMKKLREQVVKAASSNLSVMVQGETGTGKELVSQAVHDLSNRCKKPFIAINCAAIPEHLLESELFGYVKGAFSGADSNKKGLLEDADGGTLFLDEIGDMPLGLQAKLLRVLESQNYRPVGSKKEFSSDFRLVVATHVNLKEKVERKEFRKDLYYRIYQYPITLPSLSSRSSDIHKLSDHFITQYNRKHGVSIRGLDYRALDALIMYDFPGNVRELKHLVQYGCSQSIDGEQIKIECFSSRLGNTNKVDIIDNSSSYSADEALYINNLKNAVKLYETEIITSRLKEFSGDRAKTAKSLGIPKRTLADKCLKMEISFYE